MIKKRAAMEGGERSNHHRPGSSGGGAGEFFICFTARPSSSSATPSASASMRATSKSLMSPGRGHDASLAPPLSASFSRRLRRNGSVKGGQSPMFPAGVQLTGRKKGFTFEPPEPSSPKVTCIGQVRVKAKKRVKSKAMVRSRSQGGRARKNNQGGWVHQLPVSICEALRSFGSEFNCFLPCGRRSLCGGGSNSKSRTVEEKRNGKKRMARSSSSTSCGAVVARWLMAVQEREEEVKGGDLVGLVVEEREKMEVGFFLREREEKVGEVEVEEKREMVVVGEKGESGEEEAARVSVCIPPKNALLLMRCRSDPVKMAALANRFWGSPAGKLQCEEDHVKEEDNEEEKEVAEDCDNSLLEKEEGEAIEDSVLAGEMLKEEGDCERTAGEEKKEIVVDGDVSEVEKLQLLKEEVGTANEGISCESPPILRRNSSKDDGNEETKGRHLLKEQVREEEKVEMETKGDGGKDERRSGSVSASRSKERGMRRGKEKDSRRHSFSSEMEARRHSFSLEREARRASFSIDKGRRWSFSIEKEESGPKKEAFTLSAAEASSEEKKKKLVTPEDEEEEEEEVEASGEIEIVKPKCREEEQQANGEREHEAEAEEEKKGEAEEWTELPDCLLMMMYEPKLSMEVSKETWVCSNDFLRGRPHHTRNRPPPNPELAVAGNEVAESRIKEDGGDNAVPAAASASAAATEEATLQDAKAVDLEDTVAVRPRAAAIQQHKVSGAARQAAVAPYEPLVLTRCKSEPVRSSASLAPDASFWKDRHRPIGTAGIGF